MNGVKKKGGEKEEVNKDKTFLLEEFKQVFEQYRHFDNISQGKEAIFAVAAFGVFAFVLGKDVSIWTMLGAAVVSLLLFLYHVFAFEKIRFYKKITIERLKDIEKLINENKSYESIRYHTEFKEYEKRASREHCKWFRITVLLWTMAGLLFALWVAVITVKICETNHASQKHWPRHEQTRYHRPHR